MRVFGTQTASAPSVRKKQRAGSTGEAFSVESDEEAPSVRPATGAAPSSPVDALLAMQAVEGEDPGDSRGKKRGHRLLDLLEDVKHGLLIGVIPASKLNGLVAAVRDEQASVTDPKLKLILEDIDLRASVELEKLGLNSGY
jgi:Class II flagellar assembly regulator